MQKPSRKNHFDQRWSAFTTSVCTILGVRLPVHAHFYNMIPSTLAGVIALTGSSNFLPEVSRCWMAKNARWCRVWGHVVVTKSPADVCYVHDPFASTIVRPNHLFIPPLLAPRCWVLAKSNRLFRKSWRIPSCGFWKVCQSILTKQLPC